MIIQFKKESSEQHLLKIIRKDNSTESVTCETRSFLLHDFTHLAFESAANISDGFWGSLASGKSFTDLKYQENSSDLSEKMLEIEKVVALLQSLAKGMSVEKLISEIKKNPNIDSNHKWLELNFLVNVEGRLKELNGRWRATEFGSIMEIKWEEM